MTKSKQMVSVTFFLEQEARDALDQEVALRAKKTGAPVSRSYVLRDYVEMGLDIDQQFREGDKQSDLT